MMFVILSVLTRWNNGGKSLSSVFSIFSQDIGHKSMNNTSDGSEDHLRGVNLYHGYKVLINKNWPNPFL